MRIKHPLNFTVGIFCLYGFTLNVVKGGDTFTIALQAILAVINITLGLIDL